MRFRTALFLIFAVIATWGVVHAQKPFQEYQGFARENEDVPLPPDWDQPADFVRARLKYDRIGVLHPGNDTGRWAWGTDYPLGDRHFLEGLRRLTLIDVRSVEQVVELDGSDDIYNWPFLYGVELGHWKLFQDEADQLREYLDRGGFLMTDDFHGTVEWENFIVQLRKVFPTRAVVDINNSDPIFHVIYDLEDRVQVPGYQYLFYPFRPYEFDGFDPNWRAVYDDRGHIMMAICHNMDISDAIEHSDDPRYPEESASLAYRIAANYVMYDLTH
jgi:hypothetical protein